MSRFGNKPIAVPSGVKVEIAGSTVRAEGPKGKLSLDVHPLIKVSQQESTLSCRRSGDDRQNKALHGLTHRLIENMLAGVAKGFERKLEIVGVGYTANVEGKVISLTVGFCKPVRLSIPDGVQVTTPDASHILVAGPDKQKVGQMAADIRRVRKPEPYKGTGIRYDGEHVRRKAGKTFGSGG